MLISLVKPEDFRKFVTIELSRAHDELVAEGNSVKREHRYQEFNRGAERDPDVKAINGLINRAKGGTTSLPAPGKENEKPLLLCERALAS